MANPAIDPKRLQLAKHKRIATSFVAAFALIFVGTLFVDAPSQSVLLLRALAEAGMIGGLADWFAVVAIFNHPLGIPIPHTALLRSRKDQAADNIGRFIHEYILLPEQLAQRLHDLNPASKAAAWLGSKQNAGLVSGMITDGFDKVLAADTGGLRATAERVIADVLHKSHDNAAFHRLIGKLIRHAVGGSGYDQLLLQISEYLKSGRDEIAAIVHENSRWWVADAIDRKVANLLIDAVVGFLENLTEADSEARAAFQTRFQAFIRDLESNGTLTSLLIDDKDPDSTQRLALRICDAGSEMITAFRANDVDDVDDPLRDTIVQALQSVAHALEADPQAAEALNVQLATLSEDIASKHGRAIGGYVAETLKAWDTDLLIERFENEVGSDLQFVRINGAVLGACIGGLIFAIEWLAGA